MKRVSSGQVLEDAHTVKSREPLPPGQEVFILTEWSAEAVFELAQLLAKQGRVEEAVQVLREHEDMVREHFVFPYADAIVSTLLHQGQVEEALKVACQIEPDGEHDAAIARIAMFVFNRQGDAQRAREILRKMRNEEKKAWGEFLIEWGLLLKQLRESCSPEELKDRFLFTGDFPVPSREA
jgi:thioredoxin-like negative regulator of GroEL